MTSTAFLLWEASRAIGKDARWLDEDRSLDDRSITNGMKPLSLIFAELSEDWREATKYCSSMVDMIQHDAYLRIIGLGWAVVPYLLKEMQHNPNHWSTALTAITCEQPVPKTHAGDLDAIADDWVQWGRARGF